MGLESWDGSSTLQNVVVYNNSVHDNGDVHATYDQDVHGIHIGERVSSAWVVDNQMARNSGDGIQINAGSAALQPATHHIYVSRNTAFNNKQTGIWVKQATDVIISQNRCYGHRPSDSSYGQCMGYQYATERVWFIANHIEDSEVGIGVSSDNNLGTGTQSYFIGNVIHNIHHSEAGYNPGSAWSSSAIMLAGGIDRRVVNNTIYDVDAGVNVPEPGYGSLEITNNIIAKVAAGASNHVFIEDSALAARTVLRHNLLEGDARMRLGGSQQHLTAAQLATSGSLNADPKLANPGADDFHLLAGSPAIDAGETHAVYAAFQQRYGISIANAADGVARPQGSAYDDGAYEGGSSSCAANSVPGAPSNLTALVQSSTVTLSWIKPTTCAAPTSYVIEVGTAAGQANLATGSTGSTSTTFVGTGWPGGVYFVRVRAQNGSGSSSPSNETQAAVGGVPSAPINVTASAAGSRVTIAWAMPTVGPAATSYVVEIGSGAGLSDLAKVPVTATSIVSAGAVSGRYYVRVRAKNASGQSWPSTDAVLVVP
jgi:hypothetical protein